MFSSENCVDLTLQIDRRARGLVAFWAMGTDESCARLAVPEGATPSETREVLAQTIRQSSKR